MNFPTIAEYVLPWVPPVPNVQKRNERIYILVCVSNRPHYIVPHGGMKVLTEERLPKIDRTPLRSLVRIRRYFPRGRLRCR